MSWKILRFGYLPLFLSLLMNLMPQKEQPFGKAAFPVVPDLLSITLVVLRRLQRVWSLPSERCADEEMIS